MTDPIGPIAALAEQYGPFLFAVLFILFVPRTARKYYVACMTRNKPPPTEQEQRAYRFYFLCSVWVGIAVMGLSIGWWVYTQARDKHVYQVAIVDLAPDETILSNYYYKNSPHPTIDGAPAMHDAYFLIVVDRPFKVGEKLDFQYFKISGTPVGTGNSGKQMQVKYSGNGYYLTYRLKTDGPGLRLELDAKADTPTEFFAASEIEAAKNHYASLP